MFAAPKTASGAIKADGVVGTFKYLTQETEPSLFGNGKVYTKRDKDGSDAGVVGYHPAEEEAFVKNARMLSGAERPNILVNGFEVVDRPLVGSTDFMDHRDVIRTYYPHCEETLKKAVGASVVAAFDHNIRSASGKTASTRVAGGQQVQGPAHIVHADYTLTSARQRVLDLTRPPTVNDTLREVLGGKPLLDRARVDRAMQTGRWGIINVWRNIADTPVMVNPLAMCDATTVGLHDLVTFEIHYADRVGENYVGRHNASHRWHYYPHLTRDEALLLKTWDSAGRMARSNGRVPDTKESGEPCSFSLHSAFADPSTPDDAPDRWSIEVRCVVLFDDDAPKL